MNSKTYSKDLSQLREQIIGTITELVQECNVDTSGYNMLIDRRDLDSDEFGANRQTVGEVGLSDGDLLITTIDDSGQLYPVLEMEAFFTDDLIGILSMVEQLAEDNKRSHSDS